MFFLIWASPSSHQVILPIIKNFSKFNKIYLFSSSTKKIEFLDKRDSKYSKYCKHKKIPFFENQSFINKLSLIYFLFFSFFNILCHRPKYLYIIDKYPLVLTFLIKIFFKTKIIYHNLDYEPIAVGLFQKIIKKIELMSAKYIDVIIFSHRQRATKFFIDAKIKKKFVLFYNSLPSDFYKKYQVNYSKNRRIKNLFYFGSIGPGHGLLQLIKSVKYLDKNLRLQIYGWVVDDRYFTEITKFIKKDNLAKRIIIKLDVKDFVWKSRMMQSHLGVALYEVKSLSHKYMFPASQKINAYLAASLPVLLSKTKDNRIFLSKHKCGISTSLNPRSIARSINLIFKKKGFHKSLKNKSKKAFINEFNFENQFKKIIDKINLIN